MELLLVVGLFIVYAIGCSIAIALFFLPLIVMCKFMFKFMDWLFK